MTKQLKSSTQKCKSCGGDLVFSPSQQNLLCTKCGNTYDFEKIKNFKKHDISEAGVSKFDKAEWQKENKVIACKACGAKIDLNNLEFTATCPYCKSTSVAETSELPGIPPDAIIPFKFDEEEASKKFAEIVKKKKFVPNSLKKKIPKTSIQGVYIPAFTFDADTDSNYKGVLYQNIEHTDSKGRTYTTRRYFPISGNKKLEHRDVMIEASSKLNQKKLTEILPFDNEDVYKFDKSFVRGYSVEHYDTDTVESHTQARNIIDSRIRSAILSKYSYDGVSSLTINTKYYNEKFLYRISPIYTFEFDYKEKKRIVLMNGQTGKLGKGLPKSGWKITLLVLGILLGIVLIVVLMILLSENGG